MFTRILATLTACLLFTACSSHRNGPAEQRAPTVARGFDAELSTVEYPFPVQNLALESQGQPLRMAYVDERPSTPNGQTVLLLHGKNFSAAYWERTIRALVERGYRVVAPDQVGFGKSSKPRGYQFSFSQLVTHTRTLLDTLKVDRVVVVGHSMGGMLAARFALDLPERTSKLVLVNPIGLEDYRALAGYQPIDALYAQELKATPESLREYQRQNYYAGQWTPEYERWLSLLAGWTEHPDYPKVAWCAAQTTEMVLTQPVIHELGRISAPTLLVIGQRDRTALGRGWAPPEVARTMGDYPELGRKAAKQISGAQLVELDGIGHLPQIEAFDRFIEPVLRFLSAP